MAQKLDNFVRQHIKPPVESSGLNVSSSQPNETNSTPLTNKNDQKNEQDHRNKTMSKFDKLKLIKQYGEEVRKRRAKLYTIKAIRREEELYKKPNIKKLRKREKPYLNQYMVGEIPLRRPSSAPSHMEQKEFHIVPSPLKMHHDRLDSNCQDSIIFLDAEFEFLKEYINGNQEGYNKEDVEGINQQNAKIGKLRETAAELVARVQNVLDRNRERLPSPVSCTRLERMRYVGDEEGRPSRLQMNSTDQEKFGNLDEEYHYRVPIAWDSPNNMYNNSASTSTCDDSSSNESIDEKLFLGYDRNQIYLDQQKRLVPDEIVRLEHLNQTDHNIYKDNDSEFDSDEYIERNMRYESQSLAEQRRSKEYLTLNFESLEKFEELEKRDPPRYSISSLGSSDSSSIDNSDDTEYLNINLNTNNSIREAIGINSLRPFVQLTRPKTSPAAPEHINVGSHRQPKLAKHENYAFELSASSISNAEKIMDEVSLDIMGDFKDGSDDAETIRVFTEQNPKKSDIDEIVAESSENFSSESKCSDTAEIIGLTEEMISPDIKSDIKKIDYGARLLQKQNYNVTESVKLLSPSSEQKVIDFQAVKFEDRDEIDSFNVINVLVRCQQQTGKQQIRYSREEPNCLPPDRRESGINTENNVEVKRIADEEMGTVKTTHQNRATSPVVDHPSSSYQQKIMATSAVQFSPRSPSEEDRIKSYNEYGKNHIKLDIV